MSSDGTELAGETDDQCYDAGNHPDPDEDPDIEPRANTAWPRRALLKPDSTMATPLACYDHQGGLDPDRLRRWLQAHPTPSADSRPAVEPLLECGHRPHAPAPHPATKILPECGLQAAPSADDAEVQTSRQSNEQGLDSTGTALPGTKKNEASGPTPKPRRLLPGFNGMAWEDALRSNPYCKGHAEWIIGLLHDHGTLRAARSVQQGNKEEEPAARQGVVSAALGEGKPGQTPDNS